MFVNRRMWWTRVLLGALMMSAIVVDSPFLPRSIEEQYVLTDFLSLLLVTAAVVGRIWATAYLGGHKNIVLVQEGPYSLCRNPLYFFSFLGGVGIAIQSFETVIAVGMLVFFLAIYPRVIAQEERELAAVFGERFSAYRSATPAFVPNPALYRSPEAITIRPRFLLKAFADNIWWIIIWYWIGVFERLEMVAILKPAIYVPWWQ